jgi:DNA repair photolyase
VVLDAQKDIRYFGTDAREVLNSPETTRMGFWSVNPYVGCAFGCTYCYARYTHGWVMERLAGAGAAVVDAERLPGWLAFERRIFVKRNAAPVLRRQLQRGGARLAPLLAGEEAVVIGTATDPYQPAERRHRVTRGVLEVLAERRGLRVVIITKSPLVVRDLDLLVQLTARSRLTIHMSLITTDRALARRVEPRAPAPGARLRAMRRLCEAGVDVGVNVMPVLPGITDRPAELRSLVRQVAAAGVSHVNTCALRLRDSARRRYFPFIAEEFPDLAEPYRRAYAEGIHMKDRYREGLRQFMERACEEAGVRYGRLEEGEADARASDDGGGSGGRWAEKYDARDARDPRDPRDAGASGAPAVGQLELAL